MPQSTDPDSTYDSQAFVTSPYYQEEFQRRKPTAQKGTGKARRKNELAEDNVNTERTSRIVPKEL